MAPISEFGVRTQPVPSALQAVDLSNSSDLSELDILRIVKHSRNLTSLSLENCDISDAGVLEIVSDSRMLRSLKLSRNNNLTDLSISNIARHCVFLIDIDLSYCSGVTVSGIFELIEKCRSLRTLVITSYGIDMNDTIESAARNINSELSVVFV